MRRAACVIALGSSLLGCIFVMELPGGELDQCFFTGSTRKCGACLRASCTAVIDRCCGDTACLERMGSVDTCAASGDCASLSSGGGPALSAIGACVAQYCGEACGGSGADGGPSVSVEPEPGTTFCQASTDSCSCSVSTPPNTVRCGGNVTNALCCADTRWPAKDSQCLCRRVVCADEGSTCTCSAFTTNPFYQTTECTGRVCCANSGSCTCYDNLSTCPGSDIQVTTCKASTAVCDGAHRRVDVCVRE